jgi:catechol 2,3-dioxygenase-like lactoylglutathione lyase family enzyme
MKNYINISIWIVAIVSCGMINNNSQKTEIVTEEAVNGTMKIGAFSNSLAVKDLTASKAFYEKLGFEQMGGDAKMNYVIMKNENSLIGLFQGMFEGNIMTWNPGWDENGKNIAEFKDVREIQKHLTAKGLELDAEVSTGDSGPGSIIMKDPDGNMIFIDQHR